MSKSVAKILSVLFLLTLFIACTSNTESENKTTNKKEISNPLPSWNEVTSKQNIIRFVEDVTNESSPNFIEIEDRIATFDNDGNLWAEQPYYFQLRFALDMIQKMAPEHPEWKDDEVFQAAINNDIEAVLHSGEEGLIKIVMTSHANNSAEDFQADVTEWINTAKHPKTGKLYKEMVYQPMLEVLDYLRDHDFKLFIVSGGGIDFMRAFADQVYNIPKDQIVGSTIETDFVIGENGPQIIRLPELNFNDDKKGKPIAINRHIGRIPVFASGNSDGDLQMMQYTDSGKGKKFMLYLHHTDAEREWAYDRDSHIGRLDKGLDEAAEKGWTVIDMKKDWKVIYPFELDNDK
ncbi:MULTISPECIES: HAD family phosphatase [unclassified Lentimicrobium]|uniref:HAD family hydrolase n=1 Tax=unclassified Lentimicrobium TaxID=2677434 RepID=UPI001555A8EF|nr:MULTISPECIES: HAD family hydrolase [unclassified Lentimicrobium]